MIYYNRDVNVIAPLSTIPFGGSPTNVFVIESFVATPLLIGVAAWSINNTAAVYWRLVNNGQPIFPVSGFANSGAPARVAEFGLERLLNGPPYNLRVEAYNTSPSIDQSLMLWVYTVPKPEFDVDNEILIALMQIRDKLQKRRVLNGNLR